MTQNRFCIRYGSFMVFMKLANAKKKHSTGFFGSNEYLRLTLWLTRSLKGQFVVWLLTWQFFKISIRGWRSTRKKSHVSGMGVPQWNMSTCLNIQMSNKWACVSLYLVAMPISDSKIEWPINHYFNWDICLILLINGLNSEANY